MKISKWISPEFISQNLDNLRGGLLKSQARRGKEGERHLLQTYTMQGTEQSASPKLYNIILMTTLFSYHHSFIIEETEFLLQEAMSPAYRANDRLANLI